MTTTTAMASGDLYKLIGAVNKKRKLIERREYNNKPL